VPRYAFLVTRANAERECRRLAAEHPERATHQWHPKQASDGSWTVVRIALPPPDNELHAETRADEKPPAGEDVRTAAFRNLGPNVGPGF
jgi:hypothetical protein